MALTYFYAELLGIVIGLVGLAMLANRHSMLATIREVIDDRAMRFFAAVTSLFVGVLLVLTHNIWSGPTLAIVVTLIAWVLCLRAVLLLFLPHGTIRKIFNALSFEQTYYALAVLVFILGIYLAWNGFGAPY